MIALWLALSALAADGPCTADVKKLCPDAKPGAVMKCLRAHQDELSPACKAGAQRLKRKAKSPD